jgi:hypothetical protein
MPTQTNNKPKGKPMNQFSAIEINKKQRDVYNAYLHAIEVATRECGWTSSDASEADECYKQA